MNKIGLFFNKQMNKTQNFFSIVLSLVIVMFLLLEGEESIFSSTFFLLFSSLFLFIRILFDLWIYNFKSKYKYVKILKIHKEKSFNGGDNYVFDVEYKDKYNKLIKNVMTISYSFRRDKAERIHKMIKRVNISEQELKNTLILPNGIIIREITKGVFRHPKEIEVLISKFSNMDIIFDGQERITKNKILTLIFSSILILGLVPLI